VCDLSHFRQKLAKNVELSNLLKKMLILFDLHHKLDLCYTLGMNFDRQMWSRWAKLLHRWGIRDFAASILEAAGPLTIVGAQLVYMLQPFMGREFSGGTLDALANLLEQPDQVRDFVSFLREEPLN
jgi:hypothetical protein